MSEVHQSGGRGDRVLKPELELLWNRENRGDAQNMSAEEKKAHRKKVREQLDAMSDTQKTALRDKLQAQWDALPAAKKQKLAERAAKSGGGKSKNGKKGAGKAERKAKRKAKKASAGQE
jgi:hypothetical protein